MKRAWTWIGTVSLAVLAFGCSAEPESNSVGPEDESVASATQRLAGTVPEACKINIGKPLKAASNDGIRSCNTGRFGIYMQSDSNFCLYDKERPGPSWWCSLTYGKGADFL